MKEVAKKQNLLFQWLSWQFLEMPGNILRAWRAFLKFNLNYFSIPQLFKTFFSHWRQYKWSYGRGFDISRYLEALFSNLISRTLGAILRSFLILIGLFIEILIVFLGIIAFLLWIIFPLILIRGLILGLNLVV
jgi:hypothetical protein